MKYMLLIYTNPETKLSQEELQAEMNGYWAYEEAIRKAGVHLAGEALNSATETHAVRVRDGKTIKTDGPFVETHEQLGGFYLLDCKDLAEAEEWAAKIPSSTHGVIEVRPVMVFS